MKSNSISTSDWEQVRLDEISIDFVSGGTPSTSKMRYWGGDIHWMRSAHITGKEVFNGEKFITKAGLSNSATNIVPKDNVLVATRVSLGNVVINRVDMAISQDLTGIILDKEKINELFLYYLLKTKESDILSIAQGTTIKGILRDDLKKIRIILPPLVEQRGIVEVLGTVDECIRLTDAVIERAEELKRGLMQRLLTRGIGHTEYKETSIGKIPKSWKITELRDICERERDITYGVVQPGPEFDDGVLFIRSGDIINGTISVENLRKISYEISNKYKRTVLIGNELLISLVGSPGNVSLVPKELIGANIARQVGMVPIKENISKEYVKYYFQSETAKRLVRQRTVRSVQNVINLNELDKIKVVLPSIKEQNKISNILSNTDKKIILVKRNRLNLERVKQGLMQVLLSGERRVELKGDGLHRIGHSREANT